MWSTVETVEMIGKVSTWLAAAFGFLAGVAAILAVLSGARAEKLRGDLKRTPPMIDVLVKPGGPGRVVATVESMNLVPVIFNVTLVTVGGRVLGGAPLESQSLHPTSDNREVSVARRIEPAEILEGYLEVRVRYESKYQGEFPALKLSGYLTKAFCQSADGTGWVPCQVRSGS